MIPSSPRRTWLFLGISGLLYFAPDVLVPQTWHQAASYPILSSAYLGLLVLLGFYYGPAICRALVVQEIGSGPLRSALDLSLANLHGGLPAPSVVTLAEHALPFVLTAGLLPNRCRVFISSAQINRLSGCGLRFLLARAVVHMSWHQRLAAVLPVLAFTVLVPDDLQALSTWLALIGALALWLVLHWLFELDADRRAARMTGDTTGEGLREIHRAASSPLAWLTPQPPLAWRLRAVTGAVPPSS